MREGKSEKWQILLWNQMVIAFNMQSIFILTAPYNNGQDNTQSFREEK